VRHGHEVHVVARRFASQTAELPIVRHIVPVPRRGGRKNYLAFGRAAAEKLKELEVDVVHDMGHGWKADLFQLHGGTRFGSFYQNLALAPLPLRWPKRLAARVLPRYRALFELERRQFQSARSRAAADLPRFVALSRMIERDILKYHPSIPGTQVRVVYNGVDTERFSPVACAPHRETIRDMLGASEDLVLLVVAHNFRLKGVATAIRTLARLIELGAPAQLVVVGRDRPESYRRLARQLGCAQRVRFVSGASDPVPFYAAADAYVQPTFYDPCSLVVLEALACGLPVVTTRCNGAAELLTPGEDGFVVDDPRDDAAFAAHLQSILDAARRRTMAAAARRTALAHTLELNYEQLLALYDEICRARHAPRPHYAALERRPASF
jgi:UDP-glucose:(heptosyl)LPS alpha-1,3-glucosyltransferase